MKNVMSALVFRPLPLLLILFISLSSFGQNSSTRIQLMDEKQSPIMGATYQYDTQYGVSDEQGSIELDYLVGHTLYLSHVNFGNWSLVDSEVKSAIKNGVISRSQNVYKIQPMTVIALRPKTSESSVYDIDNQSRLAHDATALLNRIPVITSIRKSGGYGFDPVFRGFKYDQLNIVIGGVQCATSACPNRMDPPTSQVAPNMMERIEILKGPHSLRYGTAFGGTINFIPASPIFSTTRKTFGRISGNYESNGNVLQSEGMIGLRKAKYDLSIFGAWAQGDDYEDGDGQTVQSDFARGSAGVNLGLKLSDIQVLKLSGTRNFASDADFPALAMDLRSDDTWLFNADHNLQVHGRKLQSVNTSLYLTTVDHLMDNLLKPLDPRMLNASTNALTKTYGGRTEGVFKLNNDLLYAGADVRIEAAEGDREREFLLGPNAGKTFVDNLWQNGQISHTGFFGEYHHKISKVQLVVSGRLEINSSQIKDAAEEFITVYPDGSTTQINPNISVGGINNLNDNFSIGLWLGRAHRSGSLAERFINYLPIGVDPYEMLGNPAIDPEVNNQVDLTFGYKTQRTSVDLGFFASYLQDFISSEINPDLSPRLPNSPGVRQFVNIEKARMAGFEFIWNQHIVEGLQHQLSGTYTHGVNKVTDQPLPEISPMDFRYVLSGSYIKNRFYPEIAFRHVLSQDRIATDFGETETPSFSLLDVTAKYQISKVLSVAGGIRNVLDKAYYEHLSRSVRGTNKAIQATGRNIYFSVVMDFR